MARLQPTPSKTKPLTDTPRPLANERTPPASIKPVLPPPKPGCPTAVRHSLEARARWNKYDTRIPIEDPRSNLRRFFRAWIDLLTAKPAKRKRKLRVAIYGDSNTQGDWAASFLRKLLGKQIGLGGHGFVGAGAPNKWYEHRAIRSKHNGGWRTFSVTSFGANPKAPFGHAGLVSIGQARNAGVELRPARGIESPVKRNELFSRVEVHYLCQPGGGSFRITIDGERVRDVDTNCAARAYRVVELKTKLGRHRVKLITQKPRVVVFGLVFENDDAGVVVDGIGINTGNYKALLRIDENMFNAGMRARKYDLVILATGVSMWSQLDHYGLAKRLIGRIRKALGNDVSILVLSPGVWGKKLQDKLVMWHHIPLVAKQKRELARRNHTAFWDYYRVMGGRRALPNLIKTKQIYRDLLHFPPITHLRMMRRLAAALNMKLMRHLVEEGWTCNQ